MTSCTNTETALLVYMIKYAGLKKKPQLTLYGFTDTNTGKYGYTLYFEAMEEEDRDKVKNILQESFGIGKNLIKQDDWITSYLLDSDTYLNLVVILKMNGLLI